MSLNIFRRVFSNVIKHDAASETASLEAIARQNPRRHYADGVHQGYADLALTFYARAHEPAHLLDRSPANARISNYIDVDLTAAAQSGATAPTPINGVQRIHRQEGGHVVHGAFLAFEGGVPSRAVATRAAKALVQNAVINNLIDPTYASALTAALVKDLNVAVDLARKLNPREGRLQYSIQHELVPGRVISGGADNHAALKMTSTLSIRGRTTITSNGAHLEACLENYRRLNQRETCVPATMKQLTEDFSKYARAVESNRRPKRPASFFSRAPAPTPPNTFDAVHSLPGNSIEFNLDTRLCALLPAAARWSHTNDQDEIVRRFEKVMRAYAEFFPAEEDDTSADAGTWRHPPLRYIDPAESSIITTIM